MRYFDAKVIIFVDRGDIWFLIFPEKFIANGTGIDVIL